MLSDFLNETKGFKYQITLTVTLKNTNQMEKLNLLQFISVTQQNQWRIVNLVSKMFFKKFCTGLITGLAGLLN